MTRCEKTRREENTSVIFITRLISIALERILSSHFKILPIHYYEVLKNEAFLDKIVKPTYDRGH